MILLEAPAMDANARLQDLMRTTRPYEFREQVLWLIQAVNITACGVDVWGSPSWWLQ